MAPEEQQCAAARRIAAPLGRRRRTTGALRARPLRTSRERNRQTLLRAKETPRRRRRCGEARRRERRGRNVADAGQWAAGGAMNRGMPARIFRRDPIAAPDQGAEQLRGQ